MPSVETRPLADGVLRVEGTDGRPHLLLSRCRECDARAFPPRTRCAACSGENLAIEEAPGRGTVYSWTTAPGTEPPQVVAMVRLENGLMVQGPVAAPASSMDIDAPVTLALLPRGEADDGAALVSYTFELAERKAI